jgi:hypothetical protein
MKPFLGQPLQPLLSFFVLYRVFFYKGNCSDQTSSLSVAPTRLLSCFRRGSILLLAHVLNRLALPMDRLIAQLSGQLSFFSSALN